MKNTLTVYPELFSENTIENTIEVKLSKYIYLS